MRGAGSVFCLVPFGLAGASLALSTAVSNWPQELSRYTYGALPAFAVGAYCVYRVLLPRDRDWTVLVTVLAVATTAALVVPLWTGLIDGGLVQP